MRETLEREIKLAPGRGLRPAGARRRAAADARLHLDLPRHARPAARPARRHVPAPGRGRRRALAAEAARGSARLELELPGRRRARPAELVRCCRPTCAGAELVPVARLRTRREGVRARRGGDRRRQRRRARGAAGRAALPGGRGRARSRATSGALRRLEKELRRAGARPTRELRPKLYRALDLASRRRASRKPTRKTPSGEALGDRARRRVPGAARARSRHAARRRSRGPASAAGGDAAPARVPARRAPARRRGLGDVLAGGARLARWRTSARPATSTSCSSGCAAEVAALGDDAPCCRGPARRRWTRSAPPPTATSSRRSTSDRYFALLDRLEAAARAAAHRRREAAREDLRTRRRSGCGATFAALGDDPEDDALHASRIAVKRARYAADLAAHELGRPGERSSPSRSSCRTSSATTRTRSSPRRGSGTGPPASPDARPRSPRAGSCSSSATGWRRHVRPGPQTWQRLERAARRAVR